MPLLRWSGTCGSTASASWETGLYHQLKLCWESFTNLKAASQWHLRPFSEYSFKAWPDLANWFVWTFLEVRDLSCLRVLLLGGDTMTTASLMKERLKRVWLTIQRFSLLLIFIARNMMACRQTWCWRMSWGLICRQWVVIETLAMARLEHLSPQPPLPSPNPNDTVFQQDYTYSNEASPN